MNRPFGQQKRRLSWFMLVLILALMVSGVGYANYVAPLQAKSEAEGLNILVIEAKQLVKVDRQRTFETVPANQTAKGTPVAQMPSNPASAVISQGTEGTEGTNPSGFAVAKTPTSKETTLTEPPVDNSQSDLSQSAQAPQNLSTANLGASEMASEPDGGVNDHFTVSVDAGQLSVGGNGLVPGTVNYYELKLYNPSDKALYLAKTLEAKVVDGNRPTAFLERLSDDNLRYELLDNDLSIRPRSTKTFVLRLSVSTELPENFISQGQSYTVEGAALKMRLHFIIQD